MVNYNGDLVAFEDAKITPNNRALKYGDSVFETLKLVNGKLIFWEAHYFRLMASMRMLRMKIPMSFTLEFLENEILKTAKATNSNNNLRIRLTIIRKDGGFYLPLTNEVDYLIESQEIIPVWVDIRILCTWVRYSLSSPGGDVPPDFFTLVPPKLPY